MSLIDQETAAPSSKPLRDDLADRAFTPIGGTTEPTDENAPGEEPAPPSSAQILAGAIAAGREVFCIVTRLESPKKTLSDDTAKALGGMWGPVLEKHGIDLNRYMGDYAMEISAVIGTLTIGAAVRAGVLAEIASRKPAAPPADITDIVTEDTGGV